MTTLNLLNEVHFWTSQEDVIVKHTDYGSFKYYPKRDISDSSNYESKKSYCKQRNVLWTLTNKRPNKLKDKLRELEEYLLSNKIVYFNWDDNKLQLLLSTGLLANITVNSKTGDLSSILLDKQLASKLQVNIICDGTVSGDQIICICNDGHVLGHGGQWKDGWVLEGGPRRRLHYHKEWLAVWGRASAQQPQPWAPLAKGHQTANLHLYWVGPRGPELLAYRKTEDEPCDVVVSRIYPRNLIVVEQKVTQRGAVSVEISSFELVASNLKRISVTSVPLQTQVSCCKLSKDEDRLIIGCIDGSLALLDRNTGCTKTIKASFIPKYVVWHDLGALFVIGNERGQLQYFDTALNCIKSQLVSEDCTPVTLLDLSGYFNVQLSVSSISWGPKDLIIALEQGPLVLVTQIDGSLGMNGLVQNYLRNKKVDKAIALLLSWEFKEDSFRALQKIVAYLLRQPMTNEVAKYLQDALGCFHSPAVPISTGVRHRYSNQVYSLTRRYFHQLVRADMFETAFLLAVDLAHHDLFMDLHYIAVKIGETEMAAAARAQASALLSRCSSEASSCSRSSCSQCSDTGESSSSGDYESDHQEATQCTSFSTPQPGPSMSLHSDNYLTTNFNVPTPKTYKPVPTYVPPVPCLDLPKDFDFHKVKFPLKTPAFVKASQLSVSYSKLTGTANVVTSVLPPPLPYTPPLPSFDSSIGIPLVDNNSINPPKPPCYYNNPVRTYSVPSLIPPPSRLPQPVTNIPLKPHCSNYPSSSMFSALSSNNVSINNIKTSFTPLRKITPPPLPVAPPLIPSNPTVLTPPNVANSTFPGGGGKKPQAKVKFSDTVTAFIVPEIKRPVRPTPPPYVMDPQKELADSLPLCHPNEDYLKDFAPVKKNEAGATNAPPKIKVVHFGVV